MVHITTGGTITTKDRINHNIDIGNRYISISVHITFDITRITMRTGNGHHC